MLHYLLRIHFDALSMQKCSTLASNYVLLHHLMSFTSRVIVSIVKIIKGVNPKMDDSVKKL